ncbi:MAG: hemolysin family protein [Ilumatobacteraceae bacterium]
MAVVLGVVAIVALIVTNGFFVAAEFAYVAVDRNALEAAAANNDRVAARAVEVLRRLSFMLSGAQLGITATSLLVGFIAEPVSRSALEPVLDWAGIGEANRDVIAIVAGFLVVTVAQMLFAELVPKNLAIARPDRVARLTSMPMTLFMRGLGPLISFFDAASNRLLRSVGIEPVEELSDVASLDELDTIITESMKEGSLDADQAGLLENVLAFREMRAADVATNRVDVATIDATASCMELRDMVAAGHTRFPVLDATDVVVGVVHGQSLLEVPRSSWSTTHVQALMTAPIVVAESTKLTSVLHILRDADEELAIVLDEYGEFFGVLTVEDLAEELIGEIQDESDPKPVHAEHPSDRVWLVPGSWRLDEVFDETGVQLPDGHYETIAGLILTMLDRMAKPGDVVRVGGVRLIVRTVEKRRITLVGIDATRQRAES